MKAPEQVLAGFTFARRPFGDVWNELTDVVGDPLELMSIALEARRELFRRLDPRERADAEALTAVFHRHDGVPAFISSAVAIGLDRESLRALETLAKGRPIERWAVPTGALITRNDVRRFFALEAMGREPVEALVMDELHVTAEGRCFVMPDAGPFSPGSLAMRSLTGFDRSFVPEDASRYEVPPARMKEELVVRLELVSAIVDRLLEVGRIIRDLEEGDLPIPDRRRAAIERAAIGVSVEHASDLPTLSRALTAAVADLAS